MQIVPVDDERRLFTVTDVLSESDLQKLLSVDWQNVLWERPEMQDTWARRLLDWTTNTVLTEITNTLFNFNDQIGDACGVKFAHSSTKWWLDEPGFTIGIHTDGHLPSSMQLFWVMPTEQHATVFLNSKHIDNVRFAPKAIPNTGYIMLNGLNADGSQPLQWHGMLTPVPAGTIRVCSYTTFGPYQDK